MDTSPHEPSYQQPGYGSVPPPVAPLPLGEAIRQLPNQYIRVLTKSSAAAFAEEMGKAAWDIVWVQLIAYTIIVAALEYLPTLITPLNPTSSSNMSPEMMQTITLRSISLGLIIFIPIGFFIGVGLRHLIARAFGGQGTFLAQGYTSLLFGVPLGALSVLLGLIPILGVLASLAFVLAALALGIYAIVLQVYAIMAVYRLSGGKATVVVLIPLAVFLVLECALFIVFFPVLIRSVQPHL